jgi:hypothetical protein
MFILTLQSRQDGVYSVLNGDGDHVIPLFEEEDDAERYLYFLETDPEYPPMAVTHIEEDVIIKACTERFQKYSIITSDDFIIPPQNLL